MGKTFLRIMLGFAMLVSMLLMVSCDSQPKITLESTMNDAYTISIVYFPSIPESRLEYIPLIEAIENDEPAAIILKFFFDEPRAEDASFAEALAAYENIITQSSLLLEQIAPSDPAVIQSFSIYSESPQPDEINIVLPNDKISGSFAALGLTDFPVQGEELQGFDLVTKSNGYLFPSIALVTLSFLTGQEIEYQPDSIRVGDIVFPDPAMTMNLQISESGFFPRYELSEVLDKPSDSVLFSGHIVLVYVDIPEVWRFRAGYGSAHNNAEIVADSINTILLKVE